MNTKMRLIVGALVLAAPLWVALRAADKEPPKQTGRVLVLVNERTIVGEIERDGGQYRVRRSVGETVVPADTVLSLCDTLEEAYDFLRGRSNLRDADEHVRLARWCQLHGLREQAMAEASAAVEIRPKSAECQRLLQTLQRSNAVAAAVTGKTPAEDEAAPMPTLEIGAETMAQFISKVQPILMNTCASCHVSGKGGAFRLTRALENGRVNRKLTQQNLTAVLNQINREQWETSPLLVKAVSLHGEVNQPPLRGRQTPAYRTLEAWVRATIANNPQAKEPASTPPAFTTGPAVESKANPEASPAKPADPFDPSIFNKAVRNP